jgi:hypothetical protein
VLTCSFGIGGHLPFRKSYGVTRHVEHDSRDPDVRRSSDSDYETSTISDWEEGDWGGVAAATGGGGGAGVVRAA